MWIWRSACLFTAMAKLSLHYLPLLLTLQSQHVWEGGSQLSSLSDLPTGWFGNFHLGLYVICLWRHCSCITITNDIIRILWVCLGVISLLICLAESLLLLMMHFSSLDMDPLTLIPNCPKTGAHLRILYWVDFSVSRLFRFNFNGLQKLQCY